MPAWNAGAAAAPHCWIVAGRLPNGGVNGLAWQDSVRKKVPTILKSIKSLVLALKQDSAVDYNDGLRGFGDIRPCLTSNPCHCTVPLAGHPKERGRADGRTAVSSKDSANHTGIVHRCQCEGDHFPTEHFEVMGNQIWLAPDRLCEQLLVRYLASAW